MPIDLTRWPQASDVQQLLTAADLWPTDSSEQALAAGEIEAALLATVADLERRTGWLPFLSAATDSTRTFDAPDGTGLLDLDGGLVSLTTLTVVGHAFVPNTDFWLRRGNAAALHAPYEQILFGALGGQRDRMMPPNQIVITGRWGYCATLGGDVWDAVRQGAAAVVALHLNTISEAIPFRVAEDNFRQSFDLGLKRAERVQDWTAQFAAIISRYTRVVV